MFQIDAIHHSIIREYGAVLTYLLHAAESFLRS